MKLIFDERDGLEALEHALGSLGEDPNVGSLMILGCADNAWPQEDLDRMLKNIELPVFGGLFPSITFRARRYRRGLMVVGFSRSADLAIIPDLGKADNAVRRSLNESTCRWPGPTEASTLVVFVDGMACGIEALLQELFFSFGLDNSFVGGGAGSLDFDEAAPCIITPDGLLAGAAICARLPLASSIGVVHGWEPGGQSMRVTAARGNVIDAIDHEAALPVYERCLQHCDLPPLTSENFFEHARHHPFGIRKSADEWVMRGPVGINRRGGLICMGEVPVGSTIRIMQGSRDRLVSAAGQVRAGVDEYMLNPRGSCYLVIESISRALHLEDHLELELQAVAGKDLTFGAFALGEIASMGRQFLEFHNQAIAVARFEEPLEP